MITIKQICEELHMRLLSGEENINKEITGVYMCDMLSWVMSHATKGDAWITILTNLNVPAVALLTDVSCVIVPENIEVEQNVLEKAAEHGIVILSTDISAAELCYKLYGMISL